MLQKSTSNYALWKSLKNSFISIFGFEFYKCCDKLLYFINLNYNGFFTSHDLELTNVYEGREIKLHKINCYNFHSLRYSSSSSHSRRIDIFSKTDETLRKLNEFFVFIDSQTQEESLKSSIKLYICCENAQEEELILVAYDCWTNGHILKAYGMFSKIYGEFNNLESQQRVLTTLQCLIFNTLSRKSRIFSKHIIDGAKTFSNEHSEICILVTVWYSLFVSEWYENQCLAENILQSNLELRDCLDKVIPLIGYYFLKYKQLSSYQRLIETALHYDKTTTTGILLRALFTYYYKIGYMRGCDVVYKCCSDLDIKLTENQVLKYNAMKIPSMKTKKKDFQIIAPKDVKYKF